jgi:hypothetical protein
VTIKVDQTPPTITTTRNPLANSFGWNNEPVEITYACNDLLSGIAVCPDRKVFDSEVFSASIINNLVIARDRAGNESSPTETISVRIDLTPPTITGAAAPAPNAAGWNNSDVTVSFSCVDALSAVDFCSPSQVLSGEGADLSATGNATDKASNASSATVNVKIDKTLPLITGVSSPAPNAAGWNNSDVTVSFLCIDTLSGIALCGPNQVLSSEGIDLGASGNATDQAGNANSATVSGVKLDKTPPVITINVPANGAEYILGEVINAAWTVSDELSGVKTQQGTTASGAAIDTASSGEKSFQVSATDQADNDATSTHAYTVLSAAQATERLAGSLASSGLDKGESNSLNQKLQSAIASANRGNANAATGQINAFINQIEAQRGKKIDPATADQLISEAGKVLVALTIR